MRHMEKTLSFSTQMLGLINAFVDTNHFVQNVCDQPLKIGQECFLLILLNESFLHDVLNCYIDFESTGLQSL